MKYLKRKLYDLVYSKKDKEVQRLHELNAKLLEELDTYKRDHEMVIPFLRLDNISYKTGVPPFFIPEESKERMIILAEISGLYRSEAVRNLIAYMLNYAGNKIAREGKIQFSPFLNGVDAVWQLIKSCHLMYEKRRTSDYDYDEYEPIDTDYIDDLLDKTNE